MGMADDFPDFEPNVARTVRQACLSPTYCEPRSCQDHEVDILCVMQ